MTLLLEPGIGEVLDRQSILQLKIDMGMRKGVSTEAWEEETKQLDAYLSKKMQAWQRTANSFSVDAFGKLNVQLTIVNTKLWVAEDEIRSRIADESDGGAEPIASEAKHIVELNDARGKLIHDINAMFGNAVEEKIYGGTGSSSRHSKASV